MFEALAVGWEVLLTILVYLGILVTLILVANIIFASILVTVRFYNSYRTASAELEKSEQPEDEGPQYKF